MALVDSLKADKKLLALAQLDQRVGCRNAGGSNAQAEAENADEEAGISKEDFVALWNPIAAKYGYPSVSIDQI